MVRRIDQQTRFDLACEAAANAVTAAVLGFPCDGIHYEDDGWSVVWKDFADDEPQRVEKTESLVIARLIARVAGFAAWRRLGAPESSMPDVPELPQKLVREHWATIKALAHELLKRPRHWSGAKVESFVRPQLDKTSGN